MGMRGTVNCKMGVSHTQHHSIRILGHKHYCNKLNKLLAYGLA